MSILSSLHTFAGKLDPVVKFADRKNLTPNFLLPLPKDIPAPDLNLPVTEAGIAAAKIKAARKASTYLNPKDLPNG